MFTWKKKNTRLNGVTPVVNERYGYGVYSLCETGPSRSNNEDAVLYFQPESYNGDTLFAMVADGMGGHNAGEIASSIAINTAKSFLRSAYAGNDPAGMLKELFVNMHHSISASAADNPDWLGMGTTATAVFIRKNKLFYGHVGDSRLYRYAGGVLTQLTTDQTLVTQMIKEGKLRPEAAAAGEMKHLLLQALGTAPDIEPEISESIFISKGDCFFLCSDGIYDVLTDTEIAAILSLQRPAFALECIKSLCYTRMGRDNFSVVLIDITEKQAQPDPITKEQNIML